MLLLLPEVWTAETGRGHLQETRGKMAEVDEKKDIKCMFPNSLSQHHTHSRTS
uniref:Uncharacterized protein n=1 Tax=Anguilla anguilla TaxID=7936 RepID=A0A0E9VLP4_ANGAN